MYIYITPFSGPFLGVRMSRNRGKYEESGGEKDKETDEDKMLRHEKHPPSEWVSIWVFIAVKLGIF